MPPKRKGKELASEEPAAKKPCGPVKATGGLIVGKGRQTRASAAAKGVGARSSPKASAQTEEGPRVQPAKESSTPKAGDVASGDHSAPPATAASTSEAQPGTVLGFASFAATSSKVPLLGVKARRKSSK